MPSKEIHFVGDNQISVDGVLHVSTADAAKQTGYAGDYIARLCRERKIRGHQLGKNWYVDKDALALFAQCEDQRREVRRSGSQFLPPPYRTNLLILHPRFRRPRVALLK
jgi:hypothetical protein